MIGIHTVCVLYEKLGNGPTYYANITHKFNLKLGGVNHKVSEKDLGIIHEQATMVVGIDETHPAPKSMENAPSTVGMVASVDNLFGQWPGSIRTQQGRQEIQKRRKEEQESGIKNAAEGEEVMVSNIGQLLGERLRVYYIKNQKLPKNILIYRDGGRSRARMSKIGANVAFHLGVSEGQYQAVRELELGPMEKKCEQIYAQVGTPKPKITIVIVAKRHHTRFYPTDPKSVDKGHFASKEDKTRTFPWAILSMARWSTGALRCRKVGTSTCSHMRL